MERIKALFEAARTYLKEVVAEMRKVTWPSTNLTVKYTGIVVATVIVVALYLFVFDAGLSWGATKFLGR